MSPGTSQSEVAESSPVFEPRRAAILGVGLLGASVGLALRQRWPGIPVIGWSRRETTTAVALARGAISGDASSVEDAASGADLIIVSTPVEQIPAHAIAAARTAADDALITDVGSTKVSILAAVGRDPRCAARFIGSHPLAGSERTGPAHARADLLVDRLVVITPIAATTDRLIAQATSLWQQLGARVIAMSPIDHDGALAGTSHAPHVVAAALAASLPAEWLPLVASGWRDTTRIAGSDPGLWRQIVLDNAGSVLRELERFARVLDQFRSAIEAADGPQLERLLRAAGEARAAAEAGRSGGV
jgi:prephenate dehydrogenase